MVKPLCVCGLRLIMFVLKRISVKSITPSLWNQAKECSRGKDRKSNDLNKFIEEARIKLYNIHADLKQEGLPISATILRDKFFSLEKERRTENTYSYFSGA